MALSATIYKFNVALSDLNRNLFESFTLTVAQHPSETVERMMARVLAYCCEYSPGLEFTKGLSTPETPDIWSKALHGQIEQWVEVGEPSAEKIKKASRQADKVVVYSFNNKSSVWWGLERDKWANLNVSVYQLPWAKIVDLARAVSRTMTLSISISEDSVYVNSQTESFELDIVSLTLADK